MVVIVISKKQITVQGHIKYIYNSENLTTTYISMKIKKKTY